jgi:hypothetical protein
MDKENAACNFRDERLKKHFWEEHRIRKKSGAKATCPSMKDRYRSKVVLRHSKKRVVNASLDVHRQGGHALRMSVPRDLGTCHR